MTSTETEWDPGKPWTHPSITRLTIDELRDKYNAALKRYTDDAAEFAGNPHPDVADLLESDSRLVRTYFAALRARR